MGRLPSLAQALTALVPSDAPRIAAAHWRAYRNHRDGLAGCGWRVLCGSRLPRGTDEVLLRQARALRRRRGVTRFLLVSGDHDFTPIAALGDLHVVTRNAARCSTRLRNRARSVTVLVRDGEIPPLTGGPGAHTHRLPAPWSAVTVCRRTIARDRLGDVTTEVP
ncbi:hypothetical protein [Geodermatophilus sp. SYSU D00700]